MRLPSKGRSGWLTLIGFVAKPRGGAQRSLQAVCHVLGAGDMPSWNMALRQFKTCVTLSASPMTVTHARRKCLAQLPVTETGCCTQLGEPQ
jgi:hypothetical protein